MHLQRCLLALFLLVTFCQPVLDTDAEDSGAKKKIEAPSPDGRFAFRYEGESDDERKAYVLIDRKSGKVIKRVAESDSDLSPSARFEMSVLWKPDSERFALMATFGKRGSTVLVFAREGDTFRELKVPGLLAEIPDKVRAGKEYPQISELNSQSAKRWLKDGSLEVEIETVQDGGNGGAIQANRTVILGFGKGSEAKILKSTTKYTTENSGD